ncbi:MAG: DUF5615 family PIN-like protein [Candidatus Hydrothermarchaeales archaeon]
MKFIADTMLGRLTRWLRLSGYDVIYVNDMEDGRILRIAREEGRMILTRDKGLYDKALRANAPVILLKSNDFAERIRQLQKEVGVVIQDTPRFARCPICNGEVIKVDKGEVELKTPKKVFERLEEFWKCESCGKVYWQGGHWKNISDFVENL